MRDSKRYVGMFLLLLAGFLLKFSGLISVNRQIGTFRGANLQRDIWNPLIAESVNEREISVLVDSREINSRRLRMFMDKNLELMLPVSALRDFFNCSVHLYEGKQLLIEKRNDQVLFTLGEPEVVVNQESRANPSAMIYQDGEYFVPADVLAEALDFSYSWDVEKNQAVAVNNEAGESILPTAYDLRQRQRVPRVKDQGRYGTCWAFAALSAMESQLLPEEQQEFAPDHMVWRNSYALEEEEGGIYTMGMAYLTAWQGPVLERDDPYGDGESPEGLSPVKHVQEIQLIERKDFDEIKEAVFKYGGVQTSIYSDLSSSQTESPYYNRETGGYCYIGTETSNHMVLIIGWDDNYSKDNFKMELEGDGAFICQNSWGEGFGKKGIFYVSYYDVNIGSHNLVYSGIEEPDNYDNIYQSDLCGWVGQIGYSREDIYGANVYTAKSDEVLRAAGFYVLGKDTEYELYVVPEFTDPESLEPENRLPAASGKLNNPGYYTIPFEREFRLEKGQRYAVVLYLSTPGADKPLAIEYAADEYTATVDISDGESYISPGGRGRWEHLEETQESNLCLKVYSDDQK
ncbi:MAG: cell surface protein [Lachnospiraceae bacterium]|nr:cell surface protein [Lachnospiraceae bacterium]MCI9150639.1 cell surface protein [Lachnospiraceae bacterium]